MQTLDSTRDLAWYHFVLAHAKAVRAISARLSEGGPRGLLPLEHYDVLLPLQRAPDGKNRLRLSELADSVVMTRSGLTRMVDRLEKAGLLRREDCPDDRRGSYAVLTQKGAAALRRTWPEYARAIQECFGQFVSKEEADTISRALARVAAGVQAPSS